jgi:glycerophosphoryl diester phosphodiesterase
MNYFEIVAHRGIPTEAPENTIASFQRAVELGADAVELDVRLTSDKIPVIFHYFYLQETTSTSGAIFNFSLEQLRDVEVLCRDNPNTPSGHISTLPEILEIFGGKIGLEIEIKGPEPEAPEIIGNVLLKFKNLWNTIEVTSYEPALLLAIQKICPGLTVDLLFPRSECWMKLDVVQYQAIHYTRLAHARAVHLHPTQLSESVISALTHQGIEIHAWDVNDEQSLELVAKYGIPRLCTDKFKQALAFREKYSKRRITQ